MNVLKLIKKSTQKKENQAYKIYSLFCKHAGAA